MSVKLNIEVCEPSPTLVAVVIRLEWSLRRHAQILRLVSTELGELHTQLVQVKTGHFLVQGLRQHIESDLVGLRSVLKLAKCYS